MTTDPARFGYHPELQGVRALAVLAVFVSHIHLNQVTGGDLGVDVFFSLSGFLITSLLMAERHATRRIDLRAFYIRRGLRLYPALLIGIALAGAATPFLDGDAGRFGVDAGASLFYINDFVMAYSPHYGPLSPTWSLAVEEQFYLLWPPVLILLLSRGGFGLTRRTLALSIMLLIVARAFLFELQGERIYFLPWAHFDGILIGSLAAVLMARPDTAAGTLRLVSNPFVLLGSALLLAGMIVTSDGARDPLLYLGGFTAVALAATAIIVTVTYRPGMVIARVLRIAPLVWLGGRSYAFYLYHYPVVLVAEKHLDRQALVIVVSFVVTAVLAEVSWRLVEARALALKHRFEPEQVRGHDADTPTTSVG
jgi:peptidoglycan/LPS O-acetylase OafA/YrhL